MSGVITRDQCWKLACRTVVAYLILTCSIVLQSSDDEVPEREKSKRQRLKRQGSMLKTMFCATVRASRLVSAVRWVPRGLMHTC